MGLLERVSTLIRANINDMVDRAEDPEKMIKQVILGPLPDLAAAGAKLPGTGGRSEDAG